MDYLSLIRETPELFNNKDSAFVIITNQEEIATWQKQERSTLSRENKPISWADIGIVLENPYFLVIRDLVRFPDNELGGYLRIIYKSDLKMSNSVAILPIFMDKFIVNYQYRHATREWHIEIPRGWGEPYQSAEYVAERELFEETGGNIHELINLGYYYPNTGLEGSKISLFFAKMISIGKVEKNEGISLNLKLSKNELEDMIKTEKITDGFTIAAYTRAKLKGFI